MPSHDPLPVDRRAFCRTGLLAGAVLCQPLSATVGRAASSATALDPMLARFVQSYATAYMLQGGGLLASGGKDGAATETHLVAQIGAYSMFADAWQRNAPSSLVYADGDFLTFTGSRGQFVSVENLLSAD